VGKRENERDARGTLAGKALHLNNSLGKVSEGKGGRRGQKREKEGMRGKRKLPRGRKRRQEKSSILSAYLQ
jgi:hypothetical protein